MMRRTLITAVLLAATVASPAGAADPVQTLTPVDPLAFITPSRTPDCGAAADDPLGGALPLPTGLLPSDGSEPSGTLAIAYFAQITARPVAVTCDPRRRAAGLPGLGIAAATIRALPLKDSVGAGFRQLSAPMATDAESVNVDGDDDVPAVPLGGLRSGDTLRLAPSSPGTRLTAWLQSGSGVTPVTLADWGDGTHGANARVETVPAGLQLSVRRDDGATWAATAPDRKAPLITASASGSVRGGKLKLHVMVRGVTTGYAVLGSSEGLSGPEWGQRVSSTGSTSLRLPLRTFYTTPIVAWFDATTRRSAILGCKLSARSSRVSGRCTISYLIDGTREAPGATRTALTKGDDTPARAAVRSPTVQDVFATRAAKPLLASATVSPHDPGDSAEPMGDLNGDGHTDFALWRGGHTRLRLSRAGGGFTAAPGYVGDSGPTVAGDLDGDGITDLLFDHALVVFGAGDWATTPPPVFPTGRIPADSTRLMRLGDPNSDDAEGLYPTLLSPLPDANGDGKPEIAVSSGRSAVVVSSAVAHRGVDIVPPTVAFTDEDAPTFLYNLGVDDRVVVDSAGMHQLVRITPASRSRTASVVVIRTVDATGRSTQTAPFTIAGSPQLTERDPGTGDWLVVSVSTGCRLRKTGPCLQRVLRLHADGSVRAMFAQRGRGPGAGTAFFGPDGPDADAERDVYASDTSTSLEDGAAILTLPSSANGTVSVSGIAKLSVGGKPVLADFPSSNDNQLPAPYGLTMTAASFTAQVRSRTRWSEITPRR